MKKNEESRTAYPLTWPISYPRTPAHKRTHSKFKVTLDAAVSDLLHALDVLGVTGIVVISTNIPTRYDRNYDGYRPLASSERKDIDPGVAVYWTAREGGRLVPKVMACDAWGSVRENVRAIWQAIEGLRAIDRSRASALFERAYQGFNALPAGDDIAPPKPKRTWREVLGFTMRVASLHDVKQAHRKLALTAHPDLQGGSNELMLELNLALEEAKAELAE